MEREAEEILAKEPFQAVLGLVVGFFVVSLVVLVMFFVKYFFFDAFYGALFL